MAYATAANIQHKLQNAGIGTAGNTLYDDNGITIALAQTQIIINAYIWGKADGGDVTGDNATLAQMVQIDLIFQTILQARHMQENNLASAADIQGYWQVSPSFTRFHITMLDIIKANVDGVAWAFDTQTGAQVI